MRWKYKIFMYSNIFYIKRGTQTKENARDIKRTCPLLLARCLSLYCTYCLLCAYNKDKYLLYICFVTCALLVGDELHIFLMIAKYSYGSRRVETENRGWTNKSECQYISKGISNRRYQVVYLDMFNLWQGG